MVAFYHVLTLTGLKVAPSVDSLNMDKTRHIDINVQIKNGLTRDMMKPAPLNHVSISYQVMTLDMDILLVGENVM